MLQFLAGNFTNLESKNNEINTKFLISGYEGANYHQNIIWVEVNAMSSHRLIGGAVVAAGVLAFGGLALAQPRWAGSDLQGAVERTCIVEIAASQNRLTLQNLCYNPRAVRISWEGGRLVDYCLNSSGDVRFVQKLSNNYDLVREQDILLCQ